MPAWLAPVASVAGSLIGGLFGRESDKRNADSAAAASRANYEMQKEFAQHGIRWKVEDAKAAGLHPLAALGAQVSSPSPAFVGSVDTNPMGTAIDNMGQNLSRAIAAKSTPLERLQMRLLNAQVEGQEIENAAKASQMARLHGAGMPPPFPVGGVTGDVSIVPKEIIANTGPYEKGVSPSHQRLQFSPHSDIRAMSSALSDAGLDDGPANWYYQATRTIPDMIVSDAKTAYRSYMSKGTKMLRKFKNHKFQSIR